MLKFFNLRMAILSEISQIMNIANLVQILKNKFPKSCPRRGSNPRPAPSKEHALPASHPPPNTHKDLKTLINLIIVLSMYKYARDGRKKCRKTLSVSIIYIRAFHKRPNQA